MNPQHVPLSQGESVEIPMEETPAEYIQRTASTSSVLSRQSLRLETASPSTKRGRDEERLSGGEQPPWKLHPSSSKKRVSGQGGAGEMVQEVVIESTASKIQIRLFGGRMSPPTITTHEVSHAQAQAQSKASEDDHHFAVPEPRTVPIHAFTTDDGGQSLTGTVPLQIAPSTTVAELFRLVSQKTGTPIQSQHLLVIPSKTFSHADAEELRLKISGQHPVAMAQQLTDFLEHDDVESCDPIHGFVPPVKKASSKPIRDRMDALQRQLIEQDGKVTAAQRLQWEEVIEAEREMLREEKAGAPEMYMNLRNVVFDLRSEYWDIYKSVHQLIKTREPAALRKIADVLSRLELPRTAPIQSRTDIVDLLQDGYKVKHQFYDPFMRKLAMCIGNVQYLAGDVKGIWRVVEKSELRPNPAPERVFDIVRGAICAAEIATLAAVLEQLINSPEVEIVRVKNRLKEPTNSGWADCLVNFVFRDDPNRHICELQLMHENLLLVRRNMGAHSRSYIWFRTALSLVEMDQRWTDECALLDLFTAADGPRWKKKDNWATNAPLNRWHGVTVDQSGCVSKLRLDNNNLKGPINDTIGNLRYLRSLSLRNNHLRCHIPDSMSKLVSLRILHLGNNQLQGTIPKGLGNLTALQRLGLANNQLEGSIPKCFEVLTKITRIYLNDNKIEGRIPDWIGRLTSLQELYLSNNKLEGKIPDGIGYLTRLQHLVCGDNKLHGVIPDSICNLTNLSILTLSNNQLEGQIPARIGELVSLGQLELHENYLRGCIPDSITCLTNLSILHLNHNRLEGAIPEYIGELFQLEQLALNNNRLQACIPESISQLTNLYWLHLQHNELEGPIPPGIGELTTLQQLYLDSNKLEGGIPDSIGALTNLSWLSLHSNKLTGTLPPSIAELQELEELHFNDNALEGPVPVGVLWLIACEREVNLSAGMRLPGDMGELGQSLESLVLARRELVGCIPPSIGYLTSLQVLNLQGNHLSGWIPQTISKLVNLGWLDLSCNELEGEIPAGICKLTNLQELALNDNHLFGRIPDQIGQLGDLQTLHLHNNRLQGHLPRSIVNLQHIHVLSVANNCLSGPVPEELTGLRYLEKLHLSGNAFGVPEELKADLKRSLSTCSVRI